MDKALISHVLTYEKSILMHQSFVTPAQPPTGMGWA